MEKLASRVGIRGRCNRDPLSLTIRVCLGRLDKKSKKSGGDDNVTKQDLSKVVPAKAAFIHKSHLEALEEGGEVMRHGEAHMQDMQQLALQDGKFFGANHA